MKTARLLPLCFSAALLAASPLLSVIRAQDQVPPPPPAEPPPPPAEAPPPAPVPPSPMASISLPPGLTHEGVQSIILAALQHREWTVVSTGDHTVVAHLLHFHVDATLTLSFNRQRVDFYSESYLVGHHAEDRIRAFTREDWIRNLENDITEYATRGVPR